MKRRRLKLWLCVAILCAPLLAGGLLPQLSLSGCDQNVRDAAATGIQNTLVALPTQFITMFVQAFTHALTTQPAA